MHLKNLRSSGLKSIDRWAWAIHIHVSEEVRTVRYCSFCFGLVFVLTICLLLFWSYFRSALYFCIELILN